MFTSAGGHFSPSWDVLRSYNKVFQVTGGCNDIIDIMNGFCLPGMTYHVAITPLVKNWFSTMTAGRSLSPSCGI